MEKKWIATCAVAALLGISFVWMLASSSAGTSRKPSPFIPATGPSSASLTVQVAGQVVHPGVYRLPPNSRVQDALQKAGGLAPDADASALNLAGWLQDGGKIDVPARTVAVVAPSVAPAPPVSAPAPLANASAPALPPASTPIPMQPAAPPAIPPSTGGIPTAPNTTPNPAKTALLENLRQNPVNLNTATLPQLDQIPEIGPKMGQRILDDRATNGPFHTVDDLSRIKGIKGKTLDAIRPYVVVQ